MTWEIDWLHKQNTTLKLWARDTTNHMKKCREWGLVSVYTLRRAGINVPTYRKDSWEVDWSKRDGKLVWARNPHSKMPASKEWHWIDHTTLDRVGIKWKLANIKSDQGRYVNTHGYVTLTRRGMTQEEIMIAEENGLFKGKNRMFLWEHQLVAACKYGGIPKGMVVRHINGDKTDNRPENLVLGTTKQNSMDHFGAVRDAMYWREKYEEAQKEISYLKEQLAHFSAHLGYDPK